MHLEPDEGVRTNLTFGSAKQFVITSLHTVQFRGSAGAEEAVGDSFWRPVSSPIFWKKDHAGYALELCTCHTSLCVCVVSKARLSGTYGVVQGRNL